MLDNLNIKKILSLIFCIFIITDLIISYNRYESLVLDGDIIPIILPSSWYQDVLNDPMGIKPITEGKCYAGTNRYFAHASMIVWFKGFYSLYSPFWKDKVACIYSLQALFNTLVHLALLLLLSVYVCGHFRFWQYDFLRIAAFITPFFMIYPLGEILGLVMWSVTYSFFYSLPIAVFMFFFLPYYLAFLHEKPLREYMGIFGFGVRLFLVFYLSFSGVILQPISMMVSALIVLLKCREIIREKNWERSIANSLRAFLSAGKEYNLILPLFIILNLYSFYVGTFNIENGEPVSLAFRYLALLKGVYTQWTYSAVYWYILGLLAISFFMIKKVYPDFREHKIYHFLRWGIIILGIYLLLLPLGGYRSYRMYILRFDTMMPANIFIVWLCAYIVHFLWDKLPPKLTLMYWIPVLTILGIFYFSESLENHYNDCQRTNFYQLVNEKQELIILNKDCPILAWEAINKEFDVNLLNQMLLEWKMIDSPKKFEYR